VRVSTNQNSSAASAVAANTMMRRAVAAACPMFSTYLFDRLGVNWGLTSIACLATLFVPIPIGFVTVERKLGVGVNLRQRQLCKRMKIRKALDRTSLV
jgi:hypothetical protein